MFACVVCLCVCVLSSWYSSTNLSSIQIFHSDGKRPDSNSIVPWKCPFLQQNLSRVERSNARTRSNVGPSNYIHVSNRVKSPTSPRGGGGGGGVSRNNDRRIMCMNKEKMNGTSK